MVLLFKLLNPHSIVRGLALNIIGDLGDRHVFLQSLLFLRAKFAQVGHPIFQTFDLLIATRLLFLLMADL